MKILFVGIGKTKQKFVAEGVERYKKLVSIYASVEEKYLKEENEAKKDAVMKESSALLKNVPAGYKKILLDVQGKRMDSIFFSDYIKSLKDSSGAPGAAFIIGGSNGTCPELKKEADMCLSLSDMTTTHELIRLFLAEQLYRAFTIINNKNYHK